MNRLSKSLTTTCEDLGMLNFASNKSTADFVEQYKGLLTAASLIVSSVGHSKIKRIEYN